MLKAITRAAVFSVLFQLSCLAVLNAEDRTIPELPSSAQLTLSDDWSEGEIDPTRWYVMRKHWGNGNNGVVPENVFIRKENVAGIEKNVLVCRATGDKYNGDITGKDGERTRVGGVIASRKHFASGRYEVTLKVGDSRPHAGGPLEPTSPSGAIPAVWTYAYRYVSAPATNRDQFTKETPLFNPHMRVYGGVANEYWSELDFPEFGKAGKISSGLYNTFLQNKHESKTFDASAATDGKYHTLTTDWRTQLIPLQEIRDDQVVESEGFWWIQDNSIPFHIYYGNPLKKLGPDQYAVYTGLSATHWIDGKFVGVNARFVPSMAAQLTVGIWLPGWAGPADWETAEVSFSNIRIWEFYDEGDVRGILTGNVPDNFDATGQPLKR